MDRVNNDLMTGIIGSIGIICIEVMAHLPPLPLNFAEYNELLKTVIQLSVGISSIYFMYRNNKKNNK